MILRSFDRGDTAELPELHVVAGDAHPRGAAACGATPSALGWSYPVLDDLRVWLHAPNCHGCLAVTEVEHDPGHAANRALGIQAGEGTEAYAPAAPEFPVEAGR